MYKRLLRSVLAAAFTAVVAFGVLGGGGSGWVISAEATPPDSGWTSSPANVPPDSGWTSSSADISA